MSIRVKTLDAAVAEAKRFLEAASVVKHAAGSTELTKGSIALRQSGPVWIYRRLWSLCGVGREETK